MTVKEIKKKLEEFDNDQIVIITNGVGWSNIEKIEVKGKEVHIVEETEPVFSN